MQSIPIFDTIGTLQIFRDDADPTAFYYLPRTLRIKKDPADKPMFTFLKYTFPVERQTSDEKGGGYLVFTTELTDDADFLTSEVLPKLAARIRAENPNLANPPDPKLKAMDFLSGEVRLLLMKDDKFVSEIQAGKPSLFGDNTASFAVELKTMGADLLYQALKKGVGVAAVEYNLMFDVRLPAVHVHGYADSHEILTATMTMGFEHITDESVWGDEESTVAHRTSISETLWSQSIVKMEVDVGSSGVKEADVTEIRAFGFSKMDDWVKEHLLKGGSIATDEDRKSAWTQSIHEDIHETFNLDLVQRSVIQRGYNPSAQMTTGFLGGDVDSMVLDIDLGTAEWYWNSLNLKVNTSFDFGKYGDIVHSVVGRFSYTGTAKDGARIDKQESLIFTAEDQNPKEFKTRLAAVGADTFHVDVEVHYKSGPVTSAVLVSEDKSAVRDYTLEVPNPGVMEISVFAQDLQSFDSLKLSSIEVEIGYGDLSRKVPDVVDTVALTKEDPAVEYKRVIYAPWDKPFRVRKTYVVTDGAATQRITTDWETVEHQAQAKHHLSIGTPFDTIFTLTVMPSVDWTDVASVLVDLEYVDEANDYRQKTTLSFSDATAAKWSFPLRDPDKRNYRVSEKWLMANAAVRAGSWQEMGSDADTLHVGNAKGGVELLKVDADDVALGAEVRRVVVKLKYDDPTGNVRDSVTLVFKDKTPQTWSVAQADAAVTRYTYDIEYVMADGTVRTILGRSGEFTDSPEDPLFLPAAPAAATPSG